ncbi:MAG: Ig-like domain-containing protein [Prevotella sp.]|nr:Ig-like domain-containing protein [Prevotella sp.]
MKQTLHTSRRAFKLALLCLMAFVTWGGNYCIAQETAYKTLSFPDDDKNSNGISSYEKSWTAKIGDFSWKITNFNNNNWKNSWTYIKAGSKKFASVATIDNTTPFDKAIGKIVVGVEKDVEARFVNSICLQVASDANFSNVIETVKLIYYKKTDFVFNVSAPQANLYYRLKFDLKQGSGNGFVQINKVEYYEDASNKTATSLSFDAPSYTISKDQTLTKLPTLKADEQTLSGKTITWSSDNEKVATVDENGKVTGVAAGNAKITAKFAGDDEYETSTASYEIIVKGAPSLSFPETSYTVEMGDVFSTPKLEGLPEGVTSAYTSSNKEVATVDAATGEVKIVGVGTTTITVTSPETGIYEGATASYELNVKAAIYKVEFDFTTNNWGLPTGYNKGEASYTNEAGYTITFGISSSGHKIMGSDSDCNLIFGKEDATLSLPAFPFAVSKIKVFGKKGASGKVTQNIFVGNEAVSTETTNATEDHIYEIAEAFQAAGNIYTLKVTNPNNTQIAKIVVYAKDETIAGAINIATEEGYGTFYTNKNYVLPQGLTAFGYTSIYGNNTLTKSVEYVAGDIVPANTAVVVKGAKGSYNYYNTEEVATKTIENNLLKGVTTDTKIEAKSGVKRYILTRADDGILAFYRTNTGTINVKANRAYLEVPTAMAVASFSLEGSATGINNVVTTAAKQGIYTISGVRLNATTTKGLPAGIYIVDGKKVIVK